MAEFDPRISTERRYAPRVLAGLAGVAVLALGWQLTMQTPADAAQRIGQPRVKTETRAPQHGFAAPETVSVKVRPGETLEQAVLRIGVPATDARAVIGVLGQAMDTVNIRAGLAMEAAIARPRSRRGPVKLIGLSLRTGPVSSVSISRTFDGALRLREMTEETRDETAVVDGKMSGSLYASALAAGATPEMTSQIAKLFSHKLDFSRDIQPGDQFRLVFDRTVTESGRTISTGELLYAEVRAKGQTNRFYRYMAPGADKPQYIDELGKNTRSFLLSTPVDGARITSGFGFRRHPILGYNKMHRGIDFGAGSGAPVLAAGDGVVIEARRWGGYGNWVRIRHAGGWETGYAHLSRYARGLKAGQRVAQGQVIAYVGSTGRSTGPHLHFETWLKGARMNPKGSKVPQGAVLNAAEIAAFKAQKSRVDRLLAGNEAAAPAAPKTDDRRMAAAGSMGLRTASQ